MANVIEFYVPACFRKAVKWVPQQQRGRVLEFPVAAKANYLTSGGQSTNCNH
jgi:hypothetical protein